MWDVIRHSNDEETNDEETNDVWWNDEDTNDDGTCGGMDDDGYSG